VIESTVGGKRDDRCASRGIEKKKRGEWSVPNFSDGGQGPYLYPPTREKEGKGKGKENSLSQPSSRQEKESPPGSCLSFGIEGGGRAWVIVNSGRGKEEKGKQRTLPWG